MEGSAATEKSESTSIRAARRWRMRTPTGKKCPECRERTLYEVSDWGMRVCISCGYYRYWR